MNHKGRQAVPQQFLNIVKYCKYFKTTHNANMMQAYIE
jgi:hypothetical protein